MFIRLGVFNWKLFIKVCRFMLLNYIVKCFDFLLYFDFLLIYDFFNY